MEQKHIKIGVKNKKNRVSYCMVGILVALDRERGFTPFLMKAVQLVATYINICQKKKKITLIASCTGFSKNFDMRFWSTAAPSSMAV